MSDFSPFLAIFARSDRFVGAAEQFEADMPPLPEQQELAAGDFGILAQSQMPIEQDLVFAAVIDPEQYAATFPDWADRIEHHVLCELFSRVDPELSIGWVARLKLMPIPQERYELAVGWRDNGWPDDLPDWVEEVYKDFSTKLSAVRPDIAPLVAECPFCGQDQIALHVERTLHYRSRAGRVQIEGTERFVPITDVETNHTHKAWLECLNQECKATASMEDEEWTLPGITN